MGVGLFAPNQERLRARVGDAALPVGDREANLLSLSGFHVARGEKVLVFVTFSLADRCFREGQARPEDAEAYFCDRARIGLDNLATGARRSATMVLLARRDSPDHFGSVYDIAHGQRAVEVPVGSQVDLYAEIVLEQDRRVRWEPRSHAVVAVSEGVELDLESHPGQVRVLRLLVEPAPSGGGG